MRTLRQGYVSIPFFSLFNVAPGSRAGGHLDLFAGDAELQEAASPIMECDRVRAAPLVIRRGASEPVAMGLGRNRTQMVCPAGGPLAGGHCSIRKTGYLSAISARSSSDAFGEMPKNSRASNSGDFE